MHVVLACNQQLPAKGYGGPQRVVVALVRGLAALGHRVTLLALPGSRVAEATLVEVPPRKFGAAADLAAYVPRGAGILHTHPPLKPRPRPRAPPFVPTIHPHPKPRAAPAPNSGFLSRHPAPRPC